MRQDNTVWTSGNNTGFMSAKKTLQQRLASGNTEKVLELLSEISETSGDKQLINEVIHQSGRYNSLLKQNRDGVISQADYTKQLNSISAALNEIISQLPDNLTLPKNNQPVPDTPTAPPSADTEVSGNTASQTQMPVNQHLPWIIGLFLLLVPIYVLVYIDPCPTPIVENLFRIIMALGAGGVATILPGLLNLEITGVKAGSALGVMALVFLFNPAGAVRDNSKCDSSSNVTVVVHGIEGPHQKILRNEGFVVIEFAKKTVKEPIRENGEALFTELPAPWLQDSVMIYIEHLQPYQVQRPDSLYRLKPGNKVYVVAGLKDTGTEQEQKPESPGVKTPTKPVEIKPGNRFESNDKSKQINIPGNKGVININQ